MKLTGLHHITMITGDAQRNVSFYADLLGLRLVKKTVNFDAPEAYHLYFGDETGAPGSILTWFEFAGARRGTAGLGAIHTLQLGVASDAALDFWAARLDDHGYPSVRGAGAALRG
jgi:glyoxalase family protein